MPSSIEAMDTKFCQPKRVGSHKSESESIFANGIEAVSDEDEFEDAGEVAPSFALQQVEGYAIGSLVLTCGNVLDYGGTSTGSIHQ